MNTNYFNELNQVIKTIVGNFLPVEVIDFRQLFIVDVGGLRVYLSWKKAAASLD